MSSNYQNSTTSYGQAFPTIIEDRCMANMHMMATSLSYPHNGLDQPQPPLLGFYQEDTDTFYVCENQEEFQAVMKLLDQNIQVGEQPQSYDDNFLFQDILQQIMELPDPEVELTYIE